MKIPLILLASVSLLLADDLPPVDGLLPDTGGSGIPTVETIAPTKGEAMAAMLAVPYKFRDGILEVTGEGGSPNPAQWVLQAWNTEDPGTVHKLTVEGDQFISDVLSVNVFEATRKEINIPLPSVQIDSGSAFKIAKAAAAANGKSLGRVNYTLTIRAKRTPPIWLLECFDEAGKRIGRLEILATSGDVIGGEGFPKSAN